jgi:hypothetical protein
MRDIGEGGPVVGREKQSKQELRETPNKKDETKIQTAPQKKTIRDIQAGSQHYKHHITVLADHTQKGHLLSSKPSITAAP